MIEWVIRSLIGHGQVSHTFHMHAISESGRAGSLEVLISVYATLVCALESRAEVETWFGDPSM